MEQTSQPAPAKAPPNTTEVSQQFSTLIANAFGIVAALAWSDALNGFFQKIKLFNASPKLGPFVFAAAITLVAYLVGKALSRYVNAPCTRLCGDGT